jgi:ribosomal protein L11 methylase PrmA
MVNSQRVAASFRDPSGFLFQREGVLFRQVNQFYRADYEQLMKSGLYQQLTDSGWLVQHQEVSQEPVDPKLAYQVIKPEVLPFISYPYEWCFSQLKDAALLTLKIQKAAYDHGMSLKDASAYNIQFKGCKPVLIDTLSFEIYREGEPWTAYRQFCQHFLAPLALMAYRDIRLSQLLRVYIDGIPLDLASRLLPGRTRFNFSLATHLHLHAAAQRRYADKTVTKESLTHRMSRAAFQGLIDSLETTVRKLQWMPAGTEWAAYYADTNYSARALEHKKQVIDDFLKQIKPIVVWDLGGNTGVFSRIASNQSALTISFDIDPSAVELNYREAVEKRESQLLPLVTDLTNPSPSIGWRNKERSALLERGPAGAAMALALIHHLAISNNVPLESLADFLAQISPWLIIEFVPKMDSQVQRLLARRQDIFPDYHQDGFVQAFSKMFAIRQSVQILDSERQLFLMERLH